MSKIILAAALAASIAAPAFAEDAKANSQAISTAQVNFQSERQVNEFLTKISIAARKVCDSNSANPVVQQADRACTEAAIARAVKQVNEPMLTSIYNTNRGHEDVRLAAR